MPDWEKYHKGSWKITGRITGKKVLEQTGQSTSKNTRKWAK